MTPGLHRRLTALLALISVLAFASGAGLDAPAVVPAAVVLVLAMFIQPGAALSRMLEPLWRGLAVLLALRAGLAVLAGGGDPVLPMVDLLLLLLCAESLRVRDRTGDARHFALTFALLIASAAYRPGPLFALLFVAYVACATVTLVVAHLSRQAESHHLQPPRPSPRFLLRVALLSTVVLAVSMLVFLFFPRVSRGWASRGTPVVARSVIGFSDRVSIGDHGARLEPNPEVVMRVEFPDGLPADPATLHWRGRSYDHFDGVAWSRVDRSASPAIETGWSGASVEQVIYARRLGDVNVLFGLHPIVDITAQSRIRAMRLPSGDFAYAGEVDPVYRVRSRAQAPASEQLRQVTRVDAAAAGQYLQLPGLTERVVALADSFRTSTTTTYDHAAAVERWLRSTFDYSLDLPRTRREATLDHFLFERRAGHCEYFSTAMVVLLRAGGVPARNVNGFLGGDWNQFGGFLTVTQNNAHSWVEVYFPGYGWVEFDPTPAAAATAGAQAASRFAGLRRFADGLGHRWGKWVLDYDLGVQTSLMERFSAPFTAERDAPEGRNRRSLWWYMLAVGVVIAAFAVAVHRMQRASPLRSSALSRSYLALRGAYGRAGYPASPSLTPLAFAAMLHDAPGASHARSAIELYVRGRFGGGMLDEAERSELEHHVRAAKRLLRAHRRSTSIGQRVAG